MVGFAPHKFETTSKFVLGMPKIMISREALEDMAFFVDEVTDEVSWLGTVQMIGEDPISATYLIEKVYLIEQTVSGAETEMTTEGIAATYEALLKKRNGMEIVNKMFFWGHSHPHFGTTPSGPDEEQMKLFRDNNNPFFIRGIFNKEGRAQFSLFLHPQNLEFHDVSWSTVSVISEARKTALKKEIEEKVKKKTYGSSFYNHNDNYGCGSYPRTYGGSSRVPLLDNKSGTGTTATRKFATRFDRTDNRFRIRGGTGAFPTTELDAQVEDADLDSIDPGAGDIFDGKHKKGTFLAETPMAGCGDMDHINEEDFPIDAVNCG